MISVTEGWRVARLSAVTLAFTLVFTAMPIVGPGIDLSSALAGPEPIETYLVPLPEEDIRTASIALAPATGDTVHTVISVTAAVDGTIVYYDHWEDGYELDLANPVQGSTETWGDGDASNGAPPGCVVDGCDIFDAGDNASLINDVDAAPRDQNMIFYDGADQIGATSPVAVTRAAWPLDPGVVLAGAVEVFPIDAWGTSYEIPMGEDSPLGANFEYTGASIMAAAGPTTVNIDLEGDGTDDQTVVLSAGETVLVPGILEGALITANGPIQVDMMTGDVGVTYEGRWFAVFPRNQWASTYFNPVGTVVADDPATVALYNPTGSTLTVTVDFQGGSTTVDVPAGSSAPYQMPGSGARFSAPSAFYASVIVDYDATTHDWGFALIPDSRLATAAVVGWGPGSDDPAAENSSPVWVTAEGATTVYVDYDGDPTTGPLTDPNGDSYDVDFSVVAYEMLRLRDTSDDDQTGLKVYTLDGTRLAAAYGQDPSNASGGAPALDLGTAVVPLVLVALAKTGSLEGDTNGNGALDPGEIIRYQITIRNDGTADIDPAVLTDALDPNTTYVPGSTTVDAAPFADDGATPFPFDEGGQDLGPISPGQTVVVTYDVQLNDPLPPGTESIVNNAQLNSIGISIEGTSILPIFDPSLTVTKTSDVPPTGALAGDTVTYTVVVENTSNAPQDGFTVSDAAPPGTSYVAESTSVSGPLKATQTYADDFETDDYTGSTGSLLWGPDWVEFNESDGPSSGDEQIVNQGGSLALRVRDNDGGGEGVSRAVDLSGFDTADISFQYARSGFDNTNDYVLLEANDGVGGWDEIVRWSGPGSDPVFLPSSHNLDAYLTAGAAIRFRTSPNLGGSDQFFVDNLVISASTAGFETRTNQAIDPTPLADGDAPNLVTPADPFTLDPGETMTITFQVLVDDPIPGGLTEITNTAFVASRQQPTFTTGTVTDPLAFPQVTLDKTLQANADEDASGDVSAGDTLTYQFVAANTGSADLTGVVITDPLPGLSTLSCTPSQPAALAIGESLTCTATYVVSPADVNLGQIVNTATVDATDPGGNPITDSDDNTVPINRVPTIAVVKSLQTDLAGIGTGDTLDYEFVVTNTGNVDIVNISLDDPLVGGPVSCPQTVLALGESMTCAASYTVTQTDVDAGQIFNTATVSGEDPDGVPVGDSDDELAILEQNPSIQLSKTLLSNADEDGSGGVSLNDTLTYQFVADNVGNVTLNGVTVSDPLPGLSSLTCAPVAGSSLTPGSSMTCTATYIVTQADVDAGTINNTALALGTSTTGTDVSDSDDESVSTAQNPSITLAKNFTGNADEDGSGDVSLDDTLTYAFDVINDGDVTLTVVTLVDPLPGLSAFDCTPDVLPKTLTPGETVACTATYVVTQADVDAGRIDNIATASGIKPDGNPVSDDDPETVLPDRNPSIDLAKTLSSNDDADGNGAVSLGDTLTYQFVATNDGDTGLDNVTITDPLAGLSPLTCAPVAGSSLAPTESMTCTATYVVTQADVDLGVIDNEATAIGDDSGGGGAVSDLDAVTISVPQNASIALTKALLSNADEDGSGDVTLNDTLTYEFFITNVGDVTLSNIGLDDPLTGGPVTCPQTTLAPAASMTCTATHVVTQGDVDAGSISNTASVSGDDPGGNPVGDSDDESVSLAQNPSIVLLKSVAGNADDDGSGDISVGDTLTYQFIATNDGDVTLSDVTVADSLPGLSGLSCAPVAGSALQPTESMSCTATYVVTQADVDAGQIANTASVTSEHPGGDPGNPADDVTDVDDHLVLIPAEPAIQITKSLAGNADEDGSGDVSLADTLSYEFFVENLGNVTLNPVSVVDPLVGPVTCPSTSLAPVASMTCTASHVVTTADVDAGFIVNTATATGTDPNGTDVTDDDTVSTPVAQNPLIALTKALASNADEDGSGSVSLGDTLTYQFVATNDGDTTLSSVRINDPLPGLSALACAPAEPATLATGETMTCTATYVVTQADVDAGQILNTARAEGLDPTGALVADTDDEMVLTDRTAAISLVKFLASNADEDGSGGVTLNDTLTYQFVATNTGSASLFGVTITDPLAGLSPLSCVPVAGSALSPGTSMTCTATYVVTQPDVDAGQIDNTATVNATDSAGNPIDDTDDETVIPEQAALVDLVKSLQSNADEDGSGDVSLGDTLTYEFVATNTGSVTIDNVAISDPLPGLSGLSCAPVAGSSLAPSESMTCTATYVVTQADVDAGQIDNTATADATDQNGDGIDDTDDETVLVAQAPSITLVKSLQSNADEDGSGDVTLSDTLTYSFVATNNGDVTLDNVTISDPLPGLSALSCAPAAGSTLALTESMTCTATYVVSQADVDAGQIDNTATVDADDPGGNPLSVSDPESVVVEQSPSITLVKALQGNADEDGSGDVTLSDTLTYEFVVTNDGTVTLDNVTVTDPLPGLSALSCAPVAGSSLAPTESMTCTATYVVSQADVDAGQIDNTATVDADDPGGNPLSVSDPESVTVAQTPSVALVKALQGNADEDGSGDVTLSDTLTYEFVVTNDGTVTLDNVTISDPLPGLSALSCAPVAGSSLAPTESMTCTATYVVSQADVDAGQIDNTATVDADDPGGNPLSVSDPESVTVAQTPSVALVKALQGNADEDGSGTVSLDDTLTYSFVVTNDGTVTLDNVTISDPLPGLSALSCAPVAGSSLAPTESMTCTATYVVSQADVDAGQIDNTATVDADDPGGNPLSVSDPETVIVEQSPLIGLSKSLFANADEDGSGDITLNDTLTYQFVATNTGTVTLDNVTITDPLPGLSVLVCIPLAGASLAPTETMTCTATYVVSQADVDAGQIDNTATVDADDPGGNPVQAMDDNTANVAQSPSITLVKSLQGNADEDGSGDVTLSDTLTYEFVVTNDGTVTLDNVTVTDPLPGLSALSCAPVAGSSLAPTESMTCTATYVVSQADVDAGQIDNTATVDADDPGGNPLSVSDPESVTVAQTPSVALVKALQGNADEDGSGDVTLSDTLTYEFVVTNDGTVTLDNVTISDPLPGLSALSCAPVAGSSLAPTESMTCTATYVVSQADVDAGQIDNTATVDADDPGGNPLSVSDPESVTVAQTPSVALVKALQGNADEDGSGTVSLSDTLTYEFVVTNDGTVTLDNVTISDPLPGLSALSCAPVAGSSLAPTESMTCTATYVVSQADVDAGQIDNTATVDADDPGGNPLSVSDPESVTVAQTPSVALVKALQGNADEDGSGTVSLDDTLTYSFVVTNDGTVTLDNVTISDPLPGLSALTCAPVAGSSLAPTESMTCTATYVVSQADVDAGQIDNTATVDADDPGGNPLSVSDPETVIVEQSPLIGLSKSLFANADEDGSGDITLNDTLTYQFVATNTGTVTLDNVTITDPLPGLSVLVCIPLAGASLAPTESMTCTATYVVSQADVDAGQIDNTATVDATDPAGNPLSVSDPESVTVAQTPSIALVKSLQSNADEDGSGTVSLDDTLTYSFVATNDGTVTLDNVTISDPLPGLSALSCAPVAGASLAPTETMTCTATYVVSQPDVDAGQIDNIATVDATDPDGNPLSVSDPLTVIVGADPSITLAKSLFANADEDGSGDVTLSDTLTYSFVATNDGTVTLDNVTITDPLPGLSALTCAPVAGASLAPTETMTCTATYVVTQADVDNGQIDNTATVDADDPGGNPLSVSDPETVPTAQNPVIGLAKDVSSLVDNGDGTFTVTFLLVVENLGDVTLSDLVLTDDIIGQFATVAPTGFVASDGTLVANGSWDGTAGSNILAAGQTLAPGQSGNVLITFDVTPGAVSSVDNNADVTATTPSGGSVDDTSTAGIDPDPDDDDTPDEEEPTPVVFPPQQFDLTITKTGPAEVNDGDTATWSIVVTNLGPGAAPQPIVVTDVMPAALTYVSAGGPSWACAEALNLVTCTRTADLAVGSSATITLETIVNGAEGDEVTNVVLVESQGVIVETIVDNNDDEATLVIGVLPATGRNLSSIAWFGLLTLLAGAFLVLTAQRQADRLWIEQGIR